MTTNIDRAIAHAEENGWRYGKDKYGYDRWWLESPNGGGQGQYGPKDLPEFIARFDHDDRCDTCGQWVDGGGPRCFTCGFYVGHIDEFDPKRDLVVEAGGKRWGYRIATFGRTGGNPSSKGHGGAVVLIRFNDGREAVTDNLWCWSTGIPELFHERLPVNATLTWEPRR